MTQILGHYARILNPPIDHGLDGAHGALSSLGLLIDQALVSLIPADNFIRGFEILQMNYEQDCLDEENS